jgi:thiaminase
MGAPHHTNSSISTPTDLMTTFRSYLAYRRITENAAGEFARQVKDDPEMDKIEDWPQLRAYIYRKAHADKIKETIAAAEPVWRSYRAFVMKHRRHARLLPGNRLK